MPALDQSIFEAIFRFSHRSFFLDAVIVFLAQYLSYLLVLGACVLVFSEKNFRRRAFFACEILLALILSRGLITELVRFFYPHPRPFEVLAIQPLFTESSNSFPSGHAAFFFALALAIFFFNRAWGTVYLALAAVNSFARILSGVHWPFDVVAGIVVGLASAYAVHQLLLPYAQELKKEA